jgi:hypothetical protein
MTRMASHLLTDTISLAYPGFNATPPALTQIASRLKELGLNGDDRLVLDLLSNSAFMGTDGEGLPLPATAGEDGTYHIPGSLMVACAATVKKVLGNCNQIGKMCAKAQQVILVAPIPHFVTSKCCEDQGHVENYDKEDFEGEIVSGIDMHGRLLELEAWAHEHKLNCGVMDPTELVDPVDPVLRNRLTRSGIPLWTPWEPVYLVQEAYQEMAEDVIRHESGNGSDSASLSTMGMSEARSKRRRPETVITVQPVQARAGRAGA